MGRVAVAEDGRHVEHWSRGHPERPERVEAIRADLATRFPDLPRLPVDPLDDGALLRVHSPWHLDRVAALCIAGGGQFDADTYATHWSDDAARLSAGGAVSAVEAVVSGAFTGSFAVVRPPGHHATVDRAMGFCLYNGVAVAIEHARAVLGVKRVAVVDIDVHHGNGTEATYWNQPDVLYTSLHQYPFYPGTGARADRGGAGAVDGIVNVPVPAGTGANEWLALFDSVVMPAVARHAPELVVVSCGFDAHRDDPLAELNLDTETYAAVAERLCALQSPAAGRSAWVLEGGYDIEVLVGGTSAILRVLLDA
jgi:acetoin utilization deacetylase AcuC-like enzyme